MQANVVITRARFTLLDPNGVYWGDSELISYLNGGISEIIALKPDAYTVTTAMSLVSGIAQQLPSDAQQFIGAINNTASGRAIITRELATLNQANPAWSSAASAADVDFLMPDVRDPTRFRVSPPNNGSGSILVMYSGSPTAIATLTDTIPLADKYQTALWAFVVGSAYGKNSTKGDIQKMGAFMQMVSTLVTGNSQMQIGEAPKTAMPDGGA